MERGYFDIPAVVIRHQRRYVLNGGFSGVMAPCHPPWYKGGIVGIAPLPQETPMLRLTVGCLILLAFGMVVGRRAAAAQPTGKVYRIGFLSEAVWPRVPEHLEALRGLGYVEGHNLVVERRYATQGEPLSALAAELVTHQVDLILTSGTRATQVAHQATTTIPIVFILGTDPVWSGLIASYARPGGNLTGMAFGLYAAKQLALLK